MPYPFPVSPVVYCLVDSTPLFIGAFVVRSCFPRCNDHAAKSIADRQSSLRAVVSQTHTCARNSLVSLHSSRVFSCSSRRLSCGEREWHVSVSQNGRHHSI